ncbi:MAG: hypothetical protein WA446_19640 [Steroidobacteraceae bacterium]
MEHAPATKPASPVEQNGLVGCTGTGNAHDQAEIRNHAVVGAKHCRAQVVARRNTTVPRLGPRDICTRRVYSPARTGGHRLDDRRVAALLGGNGVSIALACVLAAISVFRCGDCRKHESRSESLRQLSEQASAKCRHEALVLDARRRKLVPPQLRVTALCLR